MIKQLKNLLSSNQLAKLASANFVVYIGSAGLTFLVSLLLARVLGPEGFGAYDYADAWIQILMMFGILGFDRLLVQMIPSYLHRRETSLVYGIWQFAVRIGAITSVLLMAIFAFVFVVLFAPADQVIWSFEALPRLSFSSSNGLLLWVSLVALLMLPLRVFLRLIQGFLHGHKHITVGLLPDHIIRLLLFCVILAVLFVANVNFLPAWVIMAIHVACALISLLMALWFLRRYVALDISNIKPQFHYKRWLKGNMAIVLISAMALVELRVGVILLGTQSSLEQVSYLGISLRITALITLVQSAMIITIQPLIAQLHAQKNHDDLQKLITNAVNITVLVSLPMTLGVLIFGRFILAIFGNAYADAYSVLVILSVAQMLGTFAGPVGNLLLMTENEQILAVTNIVFVAIVFIVSWYLIPIYDSVGAGIAIGMSTIMKNVFLSVVAYRRLGIVTLPQPSFLRLNYANK